MTSCDADLTPARRRFDLRRASDETADVLVIGGGITGAGVALDAASRGLRVTMIEAEDLAFGTSRFSSKLVHGGLRYLATGDVATAVESARERHLLMTVIAPHLIRPMPQLLPFLPGVTAGQRVTGGLGLCLGDLLRRYARTPGTVLPAPRPVSPRTALRLVPALRAERLRGGVLSFDGQLVDDARLVVDVARTAAACGARILTRVRATVLRGDGADAVDEITGETLTLRARSVINATGVWAGGLDPSIAVRPSRGTHVVLDAAHLGYPAAALMVPRVGSTSRYVFALPQHSGRVIVGLTDEDAPGPIPRTAAPTAAEVDFLLASVNRVLTEPIGHGSIRGSFAGLRPLVDTGAESTADISRRHLVAVSDEGFITVLGGKLTTYRRMAEDAVDLALRIRGISAPASATSALPLVATASSAWDDAPTRPTEESVRAAAERAVRGEGARTAEDVLDRRTRIGLDDEERRRWLPLVEQVVAAELAEEG
ncbi:glycerol-3-phosphate dehydrogenase/oxidase [Microbacterium sp. USHLN186]|uniref:glycerol-3-phosphate dehydrogenase/oxidase n=1 Tax=Microbacterium sp. USHLN186 TaxID=3081286 RepID=UPI003019A060